MKPLDKEQLQAIGEAINQVALKDLPMTPANIMAELTKETWKPEKGQIFFWTNDDGKEHFGIWKNDHSARYYSKYPCRLPTTREAGAQGLVDALENIGHRKAYEVSIEGMMEIQAEAQSALDDWFLHREE